MDAAERALRPLRVSVLRLMGRRDGMPRPRRPILLAVTAGSRPSTPVFRRLRNGLLTIVGLACALLVLGHLQERFAAQARGAQEGLLGATFVSASGNRVDGK